MWRTPSWSLPLSCLIGAAGTLGTLVETNYRRVAPSRHGGLPRRSCLWPDRPSSSPSPAASCGSLYLAFDPLSHGVPLYTNQRRRRSRLLRCCGEWLNATARPWHPDGDLVLGIGENYAKVGAVSWLSVWRCATSQRLSSGSFCGGYNDSPSETVRQGDERETYGHTV